MSNIQPYIILNGTDSRSISGLLISSLPPISKPQVRTQVETVDGRDGDIVTPLGFSAYDKVIKIGLTYNYNVDEIIEFFNSEGIVTFSNEPDKYYRYAIYEQIDFEKLIKFKTAEVTLHVQPFKFSTTEEPLLFDVISGSPITVTNEGNTDSRPNILVLGNDNIDVSLNGSQILSIDLGDEEQAVIIDTEDMNAYGAQSAIKEVIAEINPIQDLHGYNYPWPAGGGKNILLKPFVYYSLAPDNLADMFFIKAGDYRFSFSDSTAENWRIGLRMKDAEGNDLSEIAYKPNSGMSWRSEGNYWLAGSNSTNKSISITIAEDCYIRVIFGYASTTADTEFTNTQLEKGTTQTSYEPIENICPITGFNEANVTRVGNNVLSGEVYNIPFVDDQGDPITVFGGSINLTTGLLRITYKIVDLGTLNWNYFARNTRFAVTLNNGKFTNSAFGLNTALCEIYPVVTTGYGTMPDKSISVGSNFFSGSTCALVIHDEAYTTANELKTALSGQHVVYELATPIEIQLTPTQITNLLGLNQLYTDTNGDITVTFSSDGVIRTETGDIVSFNVGAEDMTKGILLNRLITGDYDKIRLRKGVNTLTLTGGAQQLVIDKYSRWL